MGKYNPKKSGIIQGTNQKSIKSMKNIFIELVVVAVIKIV